MDYLSPACWDSGRMNLPALQSRMKLDPESYASELRLLRSHFASMLDLFHARSTVSSSPDATVTKDLGDLAMVLSHVAPFYPIELKNLPSELVRLLAAEARQLPSPLRCRLVQALILLSNRQLLGIKEILELFMDLQTLGDRALRKLAFSHIVHSIRRMNQKHKNDAKNRDLQKTLFFLLQGEESRAKRSLIVLCDLYRRRVWFDDHTANAICNACFHTSSRIMIAALSFLLGSEQREDGDDSDDSGEEEDLVIQQPQVVLSREAIYKANHKGTVASKKKKKAKLQRVIRSMKKNQKVSSEKNSSSWYSPLTHLKDAQDFAEKLFSRLQKCNERFEIKVMMLKIIARTVGLHRLILLNFYPFLQKYVQPHQRDVTDLLATAVQACHDMVPPDAVEPLFRQIVNQFVHDRSRSEAIAVGLNVVREVCLRMPLLMDEDLLQDLVLYKKSHEKAVSTAARSLITLFREICPSFLSKKDRGRPTDPKARPKAFGEVNTTATDVPGIELLHDNMDLSSIDSEGNDGEEEEGDSLEIIEEENDAASSTDDDDDDDDESDRSERDNNDSDAFDKDDMDNYDGADCTDNDDLNDCTVNDNSEENNTIDKDADDDSGDNNCENDFYDGEMDSRDEVHEKNLKTTKRKFVDYMGQLNASLRSLKRIAGAKEKQTVDKEAGVLSNEDFQRIKELKAKNEAKLALTRHGLLKKLPSSEQLSMRRVDPTKLEAHIKMKLTKEEKLALVRAGREEREKYKSRTAVKQNKTGGLSNRQKEHKKKMPLAAKRAKIARSRQEKKRQHKRAGKQFRGKKAWK